MSPIDASTTLPPDPASVSRARRFTSGTLAEWGCDDQTEIVELLVSEVVTNAVLHARSSVTLTVRRRPESLRVEVRDGSPISPMRREYGVEAATGRGMVLVEELSNEWGVDSDPRQGGKVVWFEVGVG